MDHMTNKIDPLHEFQKYFTPTHISIANGKDVDVIGKGKIKLISST